MSINRRELLELLAAGAVSSVMGWRRATAVPPTATISSTPTRQYAGTDLSGWEVALGDALHACSGEPPVTLADIETIHYGARSELSANIAPRKIMAHNITFKRFIDDMAFHYTHICGYKFRLPYLPQPDAGAALNGQTIEGGLFIWDGITEKLDRGIAFQWLVNPWTANVLNIWDGAAWIAVGSLALDTAWHEVTMAVDYQRELTALKIDGLPIPVSFSRTAKVGWDDNIAARLQAEIISVDISGSCNVQATHKAEFKDWYWYWEPDGSCQTFLPLVTHGGGK